MEGLMRRGHASLNRPPLGIFLSRNALLLRLLCLFVAALHPVSRARVGAGTTLVATVHYVS